MTKYKKLLTMDEIHARPCEVDGRPALFHRWIEEDRALLSFGRMLLTEAEVEKITDIFRTEGLIAPGCSTEVIRETFALVEYEDGTIAKVAPEKITFTGRGGRMS